MIIRAQQLYWLESAEHGTLKGLCVLAPNQNSLAFVLEQDIAMRSKRGVYIGEMLPLLREEEGGVYQCILDDSTWSIFEHEPKTKLPTK